MGLSEYPTIIATIVSLSSRSQQHQIIQLLQQHYSMEAEDARKALQSLPFRLPASFFTLKEGQSAVRELVEHGCEIKFRDALDPEPEEEEPVAEPEVAEVEHPPRSGRGAVNELSDRQAEESVEGAVEESAAPAEEPEKPGWNWQRRVIQAGSLFILISFLTIIYWFLTLERHWSAPRDGMPSELRDFSKSTLGRLIGQIDEQIRQMRSMDQFLEALPEQLASMTTPQRHELSDHYQQKASRPRPREDNIQALRAIQMLRVSLAANNKNRKAWTQLVETYQERGMAHKVKRTQRAMLKALGGDVMVELYGEALVEQLR